ncbi:MAG: SNARE protein YKT6, synaptobrevin/VAMP superfamily [Amphiamblys sp. WSBS2006]|nr:MAG: SNARE protein YKT6, synaptobrevin/VAMP superfamily [Amphiamblys sp. WSBS2006]
MPLFAVVLARKEPQPTQVLAGEYNLASFSFFQKKGAQEFMTMFACTVIERTARGMRQSVDENNTVIHAKVRMDGLGCCVITDKAYPQRVAFALVEKAFSKFTETVPQSEWAGARKKVAFSGAKELFEEYQDPQKADPILKVEKELDETKEILHQTMQSLLERGEKLDDLVAQSEMLSTSSKKFFKAAKKTNTCCALQ